MDLFVELSCTSCYAGKFYASHLTIITMRSNLTCNQYASFNALQCMINKKLEHLILLPFMVR